MVGDLCWASCAFVSGGGLCGVFDLGDWGVGLWHQGDGME